MSVLVGLSGGVDSSAVVSKLKDEGAEVIACILMMQASGRQVPSSQALSRARETCEGLGVELIEQDVRGDFASHVVRPFCEAYAHGLTPSPCIVCNEQVKFATLSRVAVEHGCDRIATGHYVGRVRGADGRMRISRGEDPLRDQSYFLCRLAPELVARCSFPLAESSKQETRDYARDIGLPAAEDHDSQGVCFAPEGEYRRLLEETMPEVFTPGHIVDESGHILSEHDGTVGFTIGQRKGLGLSGGPWYVQRIDVATHEVVVAPHRHPEASAMRVCDLVLNIDSKAPSQELQVQTRFHGPLRRAVVIPEGNDGSARITMTDGTELVVPGQTAALYQGDQVVGGGMIVQALGNDLPAEEADDEGR